MARAAAFIAIAVALLSPRPAQAGAWTLEEGHSEILFGATYSRAVAGFDRHGGAHLPIRYEKTLVQLHGEYGWNDWLTVILAPEYAHARLRAPRRKPERADDAAVEGGVRVRLFKQIGILSAQLTAKTAGAFDMSVSVDGAPGRQLELRMLYGTGFSLFGRPGFFDVEIGQRWIAGARADEVPVDMTVGLRVSKGTQVLAQSFNIVTQGNARYPYSDHRVHKLSLSIVTDIRPGLSLESGGYLTVAGQNALVEQGVMLRLWARW